MELGLFILLFFTAMAPPILAVSREYFLIQQGKTWSDAQAYCRAKHTDLAIITSDEDLVQLQKEAQRQRFSSSAWIGLYNTMTSWYWSLGNEPLGNMTNWLSGEPDNDDGAEECAGTNLLGWMDAECTEINTFLCFNANITGIGRYVHIPSLMTWYAARDYCRQYHTDLASARDYMEDITVRGLASVFSWFGLFRESWKWSDGTNFSTISWMSEQPDNEDGYEDCGYIYNGQAADAKCSETMPFFCYSDNSRRQQIIKMKIQSSQNMNDPSVKMAILEQIKQKLKDHKMAVNVTVTWREQPDGKVFHKIENNNEL